MSISIVLGCYQFFEKYINLVLYKRLGLISVFMVIIIVICEEIALIILNKILAVEKIAREEAKKINDQFKKVGIVWDSQMKM